MHITPFFKISGSVAWLVRRLWLKTLISSRLKVSLIVLTSLNLCVPIARKRGHKISSCLKIHGRLAGMRRNLGRVRLPCRRVLLLGRLEPLLPMLPHALYLLCWRTIGPTPSVSDFLAAGGSEGSHPLASLTPAQVQVLFNLVIE